MIRRLEHSLPARLAVAYGQSQAGSYASALAFNSFLTMFPLMLGVLTVVGILIKDPSLHAKIVEALISAFPASAQPQLKDALEGVKQSAGLLGLVSLLGLLWTATGYFSSMEWALTRIFGSKQRDMLRQRAMGLLMMVVFILGVVVAVTANSAAALVPLAPLGGFLIGLLVMTTLLTAIYRFVPNRTFALRDVLPGALLAGALIEILTLAFPVYARLTHGFNTYGQQFGLFFLLATWLYFLAQLLLLGAVYIQLRQGRPADEGLVASPEAESKSVPDPHQAIHEQKRKAAAGRPAGAPAPAAPGGGQGAEPSPSGSARLSPPARILFGVLAWSLGVLLVIRSGRAVEKILRPPLGRSRSQP